MALTFTLKFTPVVGQPRLMHVTTDEPGLLSRIDPVVFNRISCLRDVEWTNGLDDLFIVRAHDCRKFPDIVCQVAEAFSAGTGWRVKTDDQALYAPMR